MKISYVIPVYNSSAFLPQTMGTLLHQLHKDFEVIVVDDGSTDEIVFLERFYSKMDQVTWLKNEERKGGAYCRNLGNSKATGDILAVCDAGDLFSPNRGEAIEKFFEGHPDMDIFYGSAEVKTDYGESLGVQDAQFWPGESKPPISHPTVAYRKKVADKVKYKEGCLDTDFYEFFLIDCQREGFKFGYCKDVLCTKMDLTSSEHSRDIKSAKDKKWEKYNEYEIKIRREAV